MKDTLSQTEFYLRFLVARNQVNPSDYGVTLSREDFDNTMVEELHLYGRGLLTVDELVLRPQTAIHFCASVRQKYGWFDLPDDIMLRVLMIRRKNPV